MEAGRDFQLESRAIEDFTVAVVGVCTLNAVVTSAETGEPSEPVIMLETWR